MKIAELYPPGITLPLTSHRPPEPFGKPDYKQPKTPGVKDRTPDDVGHLSYDDMTFACHPRERHEPSIVPMPDWFLDDQTAELKIESLLSSTAIGAQVVVCSVIKSPTVAWEKMGQDCPKQVVAKIFDPLYYYHTHDMVAVADREYAQEAAAYIQLHNHRLASNKTYLDKPDIVPGFFGTWTTDITRDHLLKPFLSSKDRKKTNKKEARQRELFNAASAAATSTTSDSPAETVKLSPHSFRPVRIILLEYIDGSPLSQFCDETDDHSGINILRPTKPYEDEEKRLKIFHSMMDTMSRIGHMGIAHLNRQPSSFLIKHDNDRVVITDFSLSDVACYTDVGWQIQQKLPRPLHPISWGDIDKWTTFQGWFPADWINDVSLFDAWGEATFSHAEYTERDEVEEISERYGWIRALKQVGRLPYFPGDPEYEESQAQREPPSPIPEEYREWWDAPEPDEADTAMSPTAAETSAPAHGPVTGSPVTPPEHTLPGSMPTTAKSNPRSGSVPGKRTLGQTPDDSPPDDVTHAAMAPTPTGQVESTQMSAQHAGQQISPTPQQRTEATEVMGGRKTPGQTPKSSPPDDATSLAEATTSSGRAESTQMLTRVAGQETSPTPAQRHEATEILVRRGSESGGSP